jgi:hypothetical protein
MDLRNAKLSFEPFDLKMLVFEQHILQKARRHTPNLEFAADYSNK